MGQFQVRATLPAIIKLTASALHAGFSYLVASRGYEIFQALRVVESKVQALSVQSLPTLQACFVKQATPAFRFAMIFIVKQCPRAMEHPAMAEASAAIAEFLEGYARVAALPGSQGDSGFYSFMKGRVSSTLISYTELGRRAKNTLRVGSHHPDKVFWRREPGIVGRV